jgi:hypothetical protein
MRELCAIHKKSLSESFERGPLVVKDETEGWIVKKGATTATATATALHLSDEENLTSASSTSISPDDLDGGVLVHDPFSTYAYDDFLEYEFPKKLRQQQQQIKRLSSMNSVQPPQHQHQHHQNSDHLMTKRRRVDESVVDVVAAVDTTHLPSMRMSDFLPSTAVGNQSSSSPVYRTEWSHETGGGQSGRAMPTTAPMHSHLRCVDPNKTWNMLTRTTGPTTNHHPSQYQPRNTPPTQQGKTGPPQTPSRTPHTASHTSPPHPYLTPTVKAPQQQQQTAIELSDDLKR